MSTKVEEWRSVVGHEGLYEVSDIGRVRSLSNRRFDRTTPRLQILNPWLINGYERVKLTDHGKAKQKLVHILVLEAFVGPRPPGLQAAHLDGIRIHNTRSNLVWTTCKINISHKKTQGTHRCGEAVSQSKLNAAKVVEIRQSCRNGLSQKSLAKAFGVSTHTISAVVRRKTWSHISAL